MSHEIEQRGWTRESLEGLFPFYEGKWTAVPARELPPDYPDAYGWRSKKLGAAVVTAGDFWWLHNYAMSGEPRLYRSARMPKDALARDIEAAAPPAVPVGTRVAYTDWYADTQYGWKKKHHGASVSSSPKKKAEGKRWMRARRGVVENIGPIMTDARSVTVRWDDGDAEEIQDKHLRQNSAKGSPAKRAKNKPKRTKPTVSSERQSLRQSIRRDK